MHTEDYLADPTHSRDGENNLLEDDSLPNPRLTDYQDKALANLAAAIHKNAPLLSAEQAEMVIKWLKSWKARRQPLKREQGHSNGFHFSQVLKQLRESPEQVDLQKRAYRLTIWARLWGLAFALCGAITIGMFFVDGPIAWYWWLLIGAADLICLGTSDECLKRSTVLSKEQDRRYFLQSIREAQTLSELLDAGLFSHHPRVYIPGQPYDMIREREAVREMQEKLTDALYRDTDDYMSTWYLKS